MNTGMDTKRFFSGLLSFLFAFTQAVPSFAADTLRNVTAENPATLIGLEEHLRGAPSVGLEQGRPLKEVVDLGKLRVIYPGGVVRDLSQEKTVLLTLDAGLGKRFLESWPQKWPDREPPPTKVLAPLLGKPAGWWTKEAAEGLGMPIVSIVGHARQEVMAAYNQHSRNGVIYVESEDPAGGTGYAFYHGAAVEGLKEGDTLVIATLGDQPLFDRPVLEAVGRAFRESGADLVIATAIFPNPKGKGRIVRERRTGRILGILEQRDIEEGATLGGYTKEELLSIPEGNISIYAMPAKRFFALLGDTNNGNAQRQFYVTDIVKMILDQGGRVEAVQVPAEKAPDLTTVDDLPAVEAALQRLRSGPPAQDSTGRAGLEELGLGAMEDWVAQGEVLGKIRPILSQGDQLVGRVVFPDPKRVQLVSTWNPKIFDEDFPRWQQPPGPFDEEQLARLHQTGEKFDGWKQKMDQPPVSLAGASLAYLSNLLQSNLRHPWEFLIVDGQVIRQKYAEQEYPLDGNTFWAFVLEPGPPRVAAVHFEGNQPTEEIIHAIAGVPLILHGEDVSSRIRTNMSPQPRPLGPNEVPWPPDTTEAPFSAIGVTSDGQLFLFALTEEHVTVGKVAELLHQLNAHDAILLGGGNDVKQWILGEGYPTLRPTKERKGGKELGLDRRLNAVLAGYATLPSASDLKGIGLEEASFRYDRVQDLNPQVREAIRKLEQNMPDERRIPVNLIGRFLEDEGSIIVVAKDTRTDQIVGYIFGVPQEVVYITEPPMARFPYKPRPIQQTFYEMSWQVLPAYRESGIGTVLRKRFRNEVRQAGFAYLAFRQNDLYDETQLKSELSEKYRQGDQLFDLVRDLPTPEGMPPQQFVVISMDLPLSQRPTALPAKSDESQAGLEEAAVPTAVVTQTEWGRGPRTVTGILRESSFLTRTSNEVTPLQFFVDTREDSRTLRLAVLAAVVKAREGWPIEFRGVARQEELDAALETLDGDIGTQVILENRIATYESDADYMAKRAEALSYLPADVPIIVQLTQERLAWFDQALEAAGLKYASDELRRSVRAFLEAA